MNVKKSCVTFFAIFSMAAIFINVGCSKNHKSELSLQKIYGEDTNYFVGLNEASQNNQKAAARHFDLAIAQGSKYISRRAYEQKLKLGNIQDKIKLAKKYLENYDDDEALLYASKIFFENREFNLVISSTNNIDISTCSNELAKIRLLSLQKKEDSRLLRETEKWFLARRISQEHIDFYNDYLAQKNTPEMAADLEFIKPIETDASQMMKLADYNSKLYMAVLLKSIEFRILCAKKNYNSAYDFLEIIKTFCIQQKVVGLTKYLVSDIGKIYYAVSHRYWQNGNYFLELADSEYSSDDNIKYYALLYAGRIFDKSGIYITKTDKAFSAAMDCAPTPEDYDMALWYLLNSKLALSTDDCVLALEKYCSTWNDPYYFADFLDNLSLLLFTSAKWNLFPRIYKIIDGNADNASTAKFAYLTGRLIDKKFLRGSSAQKIDAFQKAVSLNAGTDVYYRILSAKELNLDLKEFEKIIFESESENQRKKNIDFDAEKYLLGLADFGFIDLIYPEWNYFYSKNKNAFSEETIVKLSKFLKSCGSSQNNYFYQSLSMIDKTYNLDDADLNKKIFELSYPRNFIKEISSACNEFDVAEYSMFGLVRTESFFNPIVESNKGALGLSQLMMPTFEECVKKLKIEGGDISKVDITDVKTNLRCGTFYFSNLLRRLNNSDILALFAYNAGATKVRRWLSTSKVGLGIYRNLPSDLFLETIPITETRNYGRKVIQSATLYAWLYYEKSPYDIIDEFIKSE